MFSHNLFCEEKASPENATTLQTVPLCGDRVTYSTQTHFPLIQEERHGRINKQCDYI